MLYAVQVTLSLLACVFVATETLHAVCAVGSWRLCLTRFSICWTRLHLHRSGEIVFKTRGTRHISTVKCVLTSFLAFGHVKAKATLLQLEALESGIEERLNAPPAPCLSCADWFLPWAATRDGLASSSPVFSKLTGAVKGASDSRGRGLFGDRSRRFSPQRGLSDSGSEGQGDAGLGSTPESPRKPGGRRNSLGSDGGGGLFKVNV